MAGPRARKIRPTRLLDSKNLDLPGYTHIPIDNPLINRRDEAQMAPQRLDYILLAPGESGAYCREIQVLADWQLTEAGPGIHVSDHYPVSATIEVP